MRDNAIKALLHIELATSGPYGEQLATRTNKAGRDRHSRDAHWAVSHLEVLGLVLGKGQGCYWDFLEHILGWLCLLSQYLPFEPRKVWGTYSDFCRVTMTRGDCVTSPWYLYGVGGLRLGVNKPCHTTMPGILLPMTGSNLPHIMYWNMHRPLALELRASSCCPRAFKEPWHYEQVAWGRQVSNMP
ncbi:hypothetical protein EVAR_67696_1 [Eumeta japonica]|uniref:Uncharacterized protein n=1 Tax=Eumeta variegata TaxID=151549 RepID=A0A4C2A156_EUMVA|nr:hypothetical protein EVAR_67696_1 [Eumeta japonica]